MKISLTNGTSYTTHHIVFGATKIVFHDSNGIYHDIPYKEISFIIN